MTSAPWLRTWFSTSCAMSASTKGRTWGASSITVMSIPARRSASHTSKPIRPAPTITARLIVPSSRMLPQRIGFFQRVQGHHAVKVGTGHRRANRRGSGRDNEFVIGSDRASRRSQGLLYVTDFPARSMEVTSDRVSASIALAFWKKEGSRTTPAGVHNSKLRSSNVPPT